MTVPTASCFPDQRDSQSAVPNRGQILEFNRQVPLSRPLFDGFGNETSSKLISEDDLEASGKASSSDQVKKPTKTVVHDRLPNGWLKKACKRTVGKRKGFWDVSLVTPDQKILKSAQDLKL